LKANSPIVITNLKSSPRSILAFSSSRLISFIVLSLNDHLIDLAGISLQDPQWSLDIYTAMAHLV
jgi:hypothetical protein